MEPNHTANGNGSQSDSSPFRVWGHWLWVLLVGLYFLLAAGLITLRYVLPSGVDYFRPQIENRLSQALDTDLSLGHVRLRWHGWNPQLDISDIRLSSQAGEESLHVPAVRARIDWKALFGAAPGWLYLQVWNMDVAVQRQADGSVHLFGQTFAQASNALGAAADADAAASKSAANSGTMRNAVVSEELAESEVAARRSAANGGGSSASTTGSAVAFEPLADSGAMAWLDWLLKQPLIAFHDMRLRWQDDYRQAPVLVLEKVQASLANSPDDGLHLSLLAGSARSEGCVAPTSSLSDDRLPPAHEPASAITADCPAGEAAGRAASALEQAAIQFALWTPASDALTHGRMPADGKVWMQARHLAPDTWRAWLDIPNEFQQGEIQLQSWLNARQGKTEVIVQAGVRHLRLEDGRIMQGQLDSADLWLRGPWSQVQALSLDQPMKEGIEFQLQVQGLKLQLPEWFEYDQDLGQISARGHLRRPDAWQLQLEQAHWINDDVDLRVSGLWHEEGGEAGKIDLQGRFARADLAQIHRYFPLEVGEEAREWLGTGLLSGQLHQADVLLKGDLAHFPFAQDSSQGDFKIAGAFESVALDFVPDASPDGKWPVLHLPKGNVALDRMDLSIRAPAGQMVPQPGKTINLSGLRAHIEDMENIALLRVHGQGLAQGDAYMALLQHSPIGRMLNHLFDEASATGQWLVPLSLTVPLMDTDSTTVLGRIELKDASLRLLPEAPLLDRINGHLHFSEQGVRITDQALQARLLGGQLKIKGELGSPQSPGLSAQGRIMADALANFIDLPGMQRIRGHLDYQASLAYRQQAYVAALQSDTVGLELDFPAPLAKPVDQPRSLKVLWSEADPQDDELDIRLGDSLRVNLRHDRTRNSGPYFRDAAIGLGNTAQAGPGMHVQIVYPLFDLDYWDQMLNEFAVTRRDQKSESTSTKRLIWPDLATLGVQADQLRLLGTRLDQATLRAGRSSNEQWSMNVHSQQTTGTLKWQERNGKVVGSVSGRFARLSLGDDPDDSSSLLPEPQETGNEASFDEDLNIPGMVIQADELRLYGHSLGALELEGTRQASSNGWQLDRLRLGNRLAYLRGTGQWHLRGPERGLELTASVELSDLGAWLDGAGWPGIMAGGKGKLVSTFQWRDLPWSHDKDKLSGKLTIELDNGRFLTLGTQQSKLLEFLSLQSVFRLARLEQGLSGLVQEGVPFDNLRGKIDMKNGVASIRDYKLIGSVGTVVLEGGANIVDESLDVQAVIVPNLDVSGAAIAAGIAINPLVGLGAFVSQWLLKEPLARAMSVYYHISGTWSDPVVEEVQVKKDAATNH